MKVMVIGLDGATWNLIKPWIDEGKLPTFKKLIDSGAWGPLESTIPPITIPAWVSMFSGKNPGKFGVMDFKVVSFDSNGLHTMLATSRYWRGILLWDILSRRDIKSLILNIPGTYPPYPINGHLIALDFAPWTSNTYPREIENILYKELDLGKVKKIQEVAHKGKNAILNAIYDEENKILEILLRFSEIYNYDVAFVRFGIPDHVSHHSTNDDDMLECHIFMDNILKKILKSIDFDYLLVVSDHGIEKRNERFNINDVLRGLGLLKLKKDKLHLLVFSCIYPIIIKYFRTIILRMYHLISKSKSKEIIAGGVAGESISFALIDWTKTRAFGYSSVPTMFCPVYTQSIDANEFIKILGSSKYNDYIEEIIKTTNLYSGRYIDKLPQIIVKSKIPIFPHISLRSTVKSSNFYTHSLNGIFLAYGEGIKKGCKIDKAKIYDIAPTILHILGLPIPNDMDGRVLMEIFEEDSEFSRQPVYVDPSYYERDEKEKIRSKIRELKFKERV